MPVFEIHAPYGPPPELLESLCDRVTTLLHLPPDHVWALWHVLPRDHCHRPAWAGLHAPGGPVIFMTCKQTYSSTQIGALLPVVRDLIAERLMCDPATVYIAVRRVAPFEVMVRGEVWKGD